MRRRLLYWLGVDLFTQTCSVMTVDPTYVYRTLFIHPKYNCFNSEKKLGLCVKFPNLINLYLSTMEHINIDDV